MRDGGPALNRVELSRGCGPRAAGCEASTASRGGGSLLAAAGALVAPSACVRAASAASAADRRAASQADPATRLAAQLSCRAFLRQTVRSARPALERWHVTIVWAAPGRGASRAVPPGSYYLAGGHRLAPDVISIRVTPGRPARQSTAFGHGQRC